jgi:clan AA aspartic protease (TIGR02281 family)
MRAADFAGVVAALFVVGALVIVALSRIHAWRDGQSSDALHAPSDVAGYGHGQQTAEIDDSGHCSATAWAAAAGSGGEFSVELDSGAGAGLWLTRDDAARIGIDVGSLNFNQGYRGISGPGLAAEVAVAQFRLGGVTLSDVRAIVVSESGGTNTSLVGLPILQRLNFRVVGNSCVLSW